MSYEFQSAATNVLVAKLDQGFDVAFDFQCSRGENHRRHEIVNKPIRRVGYRLRCGEDACETMVALNYESARFVG
jgi:hypothetical protein